MHLQTTAYRAATLLAKDPGFFCHVMLGKLKTARALPSLPVQQRINDVLFEYDLPHYHANAAMYFGSYEPLVTRAMKRFLRPGGVFVDVGANIGYLSATAATLVRPAGQVHAFEPVPRYFRRLQRLAELNPAYKIVANAAAAGSVTGAATIFVTREPGQNTMVPGYQSPDTILDELRVPVLCLDEYFADRGLKQISLIKIDAEGFEFQILQGLERYLLSTPERPPIICEIAPRAYALQRVSLSDLSSYMGRFGYSAHDLIDFRPMDLGRIKRVADVLFLAERTQ